MSTNNSEAAGTGTTPEEVGSTIDSGGMLQPDFDSVIDGIVKDKGIELAPDPVDPNKPADEEKAEETTAEETHAEETTTDEEKGESSAGDEETKGEEDKAEETTTGETKPDSDIDELRGQLDPHAKPATKKHFEVVAAKAAEARRRAEAAEAEKAKLSAELEEAKKRAIPKEVEEEIAKLRDTVRELDVSRDPALVAKYDKRIEANNEKILTILQTHGFGKTAKGDPIPGVVDALRKNGINRRTLEDKIAALEASDGENGEKEDAEEIRDLLRDNNNTLRQRTEEVQTLKTTYEQRRAAADADRVKMIEEGNKRVSAVVGTEAKKFDFLRAPPKVEANDAPAIRKEKERAIAAHNDRILKFSEVVKREASTPIDAAVLSRVGILYRDHVVPTLQSQLSTLNKENDALRAQMKGMKGAGDLSSKTGAGKPRPAPKQEADPGEDVGDTIDALARQAGFLK